MGTEDLTVGTTFTTSMMERILYIMLQALELCRIYLQVRSGMLHWRLDMIFLQNCVKNN